MVYKAKEKTKIIIEKLKILNIIIINKKLDKDAILIIKLYTTKID